MYKELEGSKILVVDDSSTFLLAIRQILEEYGCIVNTLQDPDQAHSVALHFRPHVALFDFKMPKLDGPTLATQFKNDERFKTLPIMLVTSNDNESTFINAIQMGVDDFISKNNITSLLPSKVFSMLRLKKLNDELIIAKQGDAIRTVIATYKHELGNALTVLEGNKKILVKELQLQDNDKIKRIDSQIDRIRSVLKKLDELKNYQENQYVGNIKVLDFKKSSG